jgi:hypothetical protein
LTLPNRALTGLQIIFIGRIGGEQCFALRYIRRLFA